MSSKRKYISSLLLILSFVLSVSTFAFWATSTEGTDTVSTSQLNVGAGDAVQTRISIKPDSSTQQGYLVPEGHAINSEGLVTESVDFLYQLLWTESQEISQTGSDEIYGKLDVEFSIDIVLKDSNEILDKNEYSHIYDLVFITLNNNNPVSLLLNDTIAKTYGYSVGLHEPKNKTDYETVSESTIYVNSNFIIDTNIFDLDLDFTSMSQEQFLNTGVESTNISEWVIEEGSLTSTGYNHQKYVFFPITKDEYTITVEASLNNIDSLRDGYGILFDTYFGDEGFDQDNGYALQFDRGYAYGEMIIRPRVTGYEKNPVWRASSSVDTFPNKYDDPSWWVDIHEFKIIVSNVDDSTRQAEIYLDDILLGVATYDDVISTQQKYVGFRLWGSSNTDFYTLTVE